MRFTDAVAEGRGCALYRRIGAPNIHSLIYSEMSQYLDEDWESEELEASEYYNDFVKFVGEVKSGNYLVVVTIDYVLPFDEYVEDVLTVWSSPQKISFPLEECFQRGVEAFVKNSLYRVEKGRLVGIGFKWSHHVDGVQ